MIFKFQCQACGQRIAADEADAGREALCPKCGALLTLRKPVAVSPPPLQPAMVKAYARAAGPSAAMRRPLSPPYSFLKRPFSVWITLVLVGLGFLISVAHLAHRLGMPVTGGEDAARVLTSSVFTLLFAGGLGLLLFPVRYSRVIIAVPMGLVTVAAVLGLAVQVIFLIVVASRHHGIAARLLWGCLMSFVPAGASAWLFLEFAFSRESEEYFEQMTRLKPAVPQAGTPLPTA